MIEEEIKTLSSRIMYKNKWMQIREDQIKRKDGSLGIYGIVEKPDYAVIVPRVENYLIMVEQYRYPVKGRFIEFPQGSWENEKIEPLDLAKAELKEETGYITKKIEHIGYIYQSYGHSNQGFNVFLALKLEEGIQELENEEQGLVVKRFTINEVEKMIIDNTIKDNASISAFGLLRLKGML
jgi:ADP-ribose pyrophosphatase